MLHIFGQVDNVAYNNNIIQTDFRIFSFIFFFPVQLFSNASNNWLLLLLKYYIINWCVFSLVQYWNNNFCCNIHGINEIMVNIYSSKCSKTLFLDWLCIVHYYKYRAEHQVHFKNIIISHSALALITWSKCQIKWFWFERYSSANKAAKNVDVEYIDKSSG